MSRFVTSRDFFEQKYAKNLDPWHFASSAYEQERYATTVKSLGSRRYRRVFEPGCSVGVLTELLAHKCDSVVATDISSIAVDRAKRRCQPYPNVTVARSSLPGVIPSGQFDLVVLSELCYYFTSSVLETLAEAIVARLDLGGVLIAVHWLGSSEDHLLTGHEVHDILRRTSNISLEQSEHREPFRLDRWRRV